MRGLLSFLVLAVAAWALVATSPARFQLEHRFTGDPIVLGSTSAHRRIRIVPNAATVAFARAHHPTIGLTLDASIIATLPGTPRPASVRVRIVPVDAPAITPVTSPNGREAHVYATVDCAHRACDQAFDLFFEWIGPPAIAAVAQVQWSVRSVATITGEMTAPVGVGISTESIPVQ